MSARLQNALVVAGLIVMALGAWWGLSASGAVKPVVLPPIADTWSALREILGQPGDVLAALWATLRPLLVAFSVAVPLGLAIGVVIGRSTLLRDAYEPLLANLNAVPLIVLYPLLAGAVGLGALPQVIVGALVAVLPIAIATTWAVRDIDATLLVAGTAMGASGWRLVRTVALPAALPAILSGMRTSLGLAFVTIIAAQFISSTEGLGYELAQMSQAFRTPELFAWVVITLIFSAALSRAFTAIERQIERRARR